MPDSTRKIIASLATAAVALIGFGAPARAASNGKIAYLSEYPRGTVNVIDATAGATPTPVGPGLVSLPAFAPDGSLIAAVTQTGELQTFTPDGSGLRTVASGVAMDHFRPGWSPDATRLAYYKGTAPDYSLVIKPVAAGGTEQVVTGISEFPQGAISWSPDGATLLFGTLSGLWSVPASAGSTATKLTIPGEAGLDNTGASWSPDGTRFAFSRMCVGCSDPALSGLWTAKADGSDPQQLVSAGITTPPSWSPDGTKIAFSTYDATNEIRIANSTGAGQVGTLLISGTGITAPSWGGTPQAPTMLTAPRIAGTAGFAQQLTTDNGVWSGSPTTFGVQWQRCKAGDPGSCTAIAGGTGATYTVSQEDLGMALRTQVTASNPLGSAVGTSELLAVPTLPKGAPISKKSVPKVLKVKGNKVKVPVKVTGGESIVSANVSLAKGKKIIGTKKVVPSKPKTKVVVPVTLNKTGKKALKKTPTFKVKVTISLVTVKAGKYYTVKVKLTRTLSK